MSLKVHHKLAIVLFFFAATASAAIAIVFYETASKRVHQDIRQRLGDIVSVARSAIDVQAHDSLKGPDMEGSEEYLRVRKALQRVRDASSDIHFIYTMRKGPGGEIMFVVDAEEDPAQIAHLGDIYDDASAFLASRFNTLTEPAVEKNTYTDEWGTWLSGYAPFMRADGTRAGVLGVDISASTVKEYQRSLQYLYGLFFLATLPIIMAVGWFLGRRLVRPIIEMKNKAEQFGQGDLRARVLVKGNDEIAVLGRTLNHMAQRLEENRERLRQMAEKYRSIFDNAVEGIFQTSPHGGFLAANTSFCQMLGYNSFEEMSAIVTDIKNQLYANPEDRDQFVERLQRDGFVRDFKVHLKRKDNALLWVEINARLLSERDDQPIIEGMVMDITERIEREKAERQRHAAEVAAQARSVFLDNSGQGFLSFGKDLRVQPEYSRECHHIFGGPIAGENIAGILVPDDEPGKSLLEKNFKRIIDEDDSFKQDLFLSLLAKEYILKDTFVEAEYKVIDEQIMLILTDVTERKKLENEVLSERNKLKFVVAAVKDAADFFDLLHDFEDFCQHRIPEIKNWNQPEKAVAEAYRAVHTFKGLFAQQGFPHFPGTLHTLENTLSVIQRAPSKGADEFEALLDSFDYKENLRADLEIIREFLGDDFLERKGNIAISREQARTIQTKAERLLQGADGRLDQSVQDLIEEIRNLKRVDMKSLLANYPQYASELAERLEKEIKPFEIQGESVAVDPDVVGPFTKSLIHVFRNAVDHGIETPEERDALGKELHGVLACKVGLEGNRLTITISDDGSGVDINRLKAAAEQRGLTEYTEASNDSDLLGLIFELDVSTKEEVSELSGRGVGLSSVKAEAERLGGDINVTSNPGRGVAVHFSFPLDRL